MSLLGNLRVRLTAETEDFRRGLASARQNLNTFEKDMDRFRRSTLANVASIGALGMVLQSSMNVANEFDKAQSKLAATSKLTGVELGFLQATSKAAQDQFKLSAVSANGFTIELTKLAQKAGDVGKASAGLEAFLDLGAARGLTAAQTLQAVQQSILGIDEGTDKLFGKNPSVLYEEFAASIGTTAGRLSDAQKAQAILTAAIEDGGKVRGEYQKWLQSSQGQQFLLSQGIEQTQAALGKALQPALVAIIPIVAKLAEWLQLSIQGWQMLGATAALAAGAVVSAKTALTEGLEAGKAEMGRWMDSWRATIAEIKNGSAPIHVPVLLDVSTGTGLGSTTTDTKEAGKATARSYFDGLKTEWEDLRHAVALRSISLTGTNSDRLALEEQHALRLLDIEQARLEAQRKVGDLTEQELAQAMREISARREIASARRRELDAVDQQLAKQQNIIDLATSVAALAPGGAGGGRGGTIGTQAGSVLADALGMSGSMIGTMVLPGVGSMIGGALGKALGGMFGKKDEKDDPVIRGLDAIERAQRETISTIKQTNELIDPTNRLLNLPSGFSVPAYSPNSGGARGNSGASSVTYGDTHVNVRIEVNASHSVADMQRMAERAISNALERGRSNSARNSSNW